MQLNLAGLVLATLTICNRRVQVANLIGFEAVNFGPIAVLDEGPLWSSQI